MNRVAMMIPGLDRIGGAERQAMLLAKGLQKRSWTVSVVALSGTGGTAADELRDSGVAFVSLGMRKGLADPRGWIRLNRWLWRERPDVVHAHLPHAAWMARWSRLLARVPVVIDTLHSANTGGAGRRFGYRCSRWLADQVTAVSHAAAASHLKAKMMSADGLTVVPNGIDAENWQPDAETRTAMRRGLGIEDEFLWLSVGRLDAVKDFPTLLRAMARMPERARLAVLGDGPLHDKLTQLTACLGLERRVRFAGFEPDVARWMQAADGFVLSSLTEGLPMVLLEAGACGLPSVATNVGGTPQIIVDGETGWLTPPGDAEALAATMQQPMRMSLERRCAMGENARRRVAQHFSLDPAIDRWEQLYMKLLARSGDRAMRRAARATLIQQRLISERMRSANLGLVAGLSASTRSTDVN